jgi:diguanylate cyclase (GGDEF)-like protein
MTKSKRNAHYTAMMLDLNGFKKINDQYGHQEGDHALTVTGELLWKAVGGYGMVIRYAGDEFVIILNTQVDPIIHEVVYSIRKQFDAFNKTNTLPYRLSISLGYSKADFKNHTVDELMNEIDKKMYEDKQIQRQKEEDSK